ncbi:MAG: hypothetical protein JSR18_09205 [Proteobacteria bacterium]|nr:hypothetical protein [Pseudomonadota bacterium]
MASIDPQPAAEPVLARVPAGEGAAWWSEGWRLFTAHAGTWIGIFVVWVVINVVLSLVPFLGSIVATLTTPVFAAGALLGARDIDAGRPLRFDHLFAGFSGGRLGPLLLLGFYNFVLSFAVVALVALVLMAIVGSDLLLQLASTNAEDVAALDFGSLITVLVVGVPLASLGWLLVGIAMWFAPGLVAVQGVAPGRAMALSFKASLSNIVALIVYDIVLLVLAIVATIPVGLGWIVLGPVLVCSWYASWRDLFGGGRAAVTAAV